MTNEIDSVTNYVIIRSWEIYTLKKDAKKSYVDRMLGSGTTQRRALQDAKRTIEKRITETVDVAEVPKEGEQK